MQVCQANDLVNTIEAGMSGRNVPHSNSVIDQFLTSPFWRLNSNQDILADQFRRLRINLKRISIVFAE